MSQPIVFFGTEDFSLAALTALIEAGFTIAAVVTKPDMPRGRNQLVTAPAVKVLAMRHNIAVWQPNKLAEIADDIQALDHPAGILVSYGKIVPERIINLFTPGIINVHPSLLPKYRGPSPIEAPILHGDTVTGVSIMKLVKAMDAGPVYTQKEIPLTGTETKNELAQTLTTVGTHLLLDTLPRILDGSLTPATQDHDKATYCPLLSKDMGELKPAAITAVEAERRVRAFLGYPKTYLLQVGSHRAVVTAAHTSATPTGLSLQFNDGNYLVIDELIAPSGRRMSGEDFQRGYGKHTTD